MLKSTLLALISECVQEIKYQYGQLDLVVIPLDSDSDGVLNKPQFTRRIKSIPLFVRSKYLEKLEIRRDAFTGELRNLLGLYEFEINKSFRAWIAYLGNDDFFLSHINLIIERKNLKVYYKLSKRTKEIEKKHIQAPVLPTSTLNDLYSNSIGFLRSEKRHTDLYEKYNIPCKRGILLCGEPGSGKTLTCKWLLQLCKKYHFDFKIVTMQDYKSASSDGKVSRLFKLKKHGIIFFDDLDIMVKDRHSSATWDELSTILTELDGLDSSSRIIYVFTTNAIKELDSAFVRPGRIDVWIHFQKPDANGRKKFIETRFHDDILSQVNKDEILEKTTDFTFAELEEIRKLFCFNIINNIKLNTSNIIDTFNKNRTILAEQAKLGFGTLRGLQSDTRTLENTLEEIFGSDSSDFT